MNFTTIFAIICSSAIATKTNAAPHGGVQKVSTGLASKFYQRWSNTEAVAWLFSDIGKPVGNIGGKLQGKHEEKSMPKDGRSKTNLKNRLIPNRFCNAKNCNNCNHGLLRNIFNQKEARYCKILIVAPDCCHNFFVNTGFYF